MLSFIAINVACHSVSSPTDHAVLLRPLLSLWHVDGLLLLLLILNVYTIL